MSATDTPMKSTGGRSYDDIRKAWRAAKLRPLWESAVAHKSRDGGPRANHYWSAPPTPKSACPLE